MGTNTANHMEQNKIIKIDVIFKIKVTLLTFVNFVNITLKRLTEKPCVTCAKVHGTCESHVMWHVFFPAWTDSIYSLNVWSCCENMISNIVYFVHSFTDLFTDSKESLWLVVISGFDLQFKVTNVIIFIKFYVQNPHTHT